MKETYPIPTAGKKPPAPSIKRAPADCYLLDQHDWEEAIFRNAHHFNAMRYRTGNWESNVFETFPEAVAAVADYSPRTLIYAVTLSGDAFCIPRKEWDAYKTIWNESMS